MRNEVIFDQYNYFEGFFFGTLNGRKNFFCISVENEEHAKKILNQYEHYDEAHLLVPGLKGFDNWYFGNETKLVSPLKWEICEEKLHVSKDSIKGKISAKTNFTLEFSNIKNKKRKMKNYSVEIIFDTNIYDLLFWEFIRAQKYELGTYVRTVRRTVSALEQLSGITVAIPDFYKHEYNNVTLL